MARKRSGGERPRPATVAEPASSAADHGATTPAAAMSERDLPGGHVAALLSLMMFMAPTLGVPSELMLQDTLKSIVVSITALMAAMWLLLRERERTQPLRWHGLIWLPLSLMAYALGSMVWSHTYLGGVEAIRWFIFALLVWLGLNTLARDRLPWLAAGIHAGAVGASVWAVLQFWAGFSLFPQGPNPASTFVNRNFFAEFVVCTLPFSMLLLARARQSAAVFLLAVSTGLVITAILMTGTRAALIALWLQLLVVWPVIAWRCRSQFAWSTWSRRQRVLAPAALLLTVLALGLIPSSNRDILAEERGATALERGVKRTQSIGPADHSLGIRMVMWRATLNAIEARPLIGLGAGAWESEIPLYQAEGSQLETDYYVHNEFLQLVAEYGVVGWTFLVLLIAHLLKAAWRTWKARAGPEQEDAPWRATFLCSLLALMVVSNIGFPWRMAATGALFALCLGGLAASDARLGYWGRELTRPLRWSPAIARTALAACTACIALALFITQRATESERKIVSATKMALTISASNDWNNPRWRSVKREMLQLLREGVAINPHYRKVTPMVADELAKWGDWGNATWIWESVLTSRPNIVAVISNAARGYAQTGQTAKAIELMQRAKAIQPRAPSVRSLEVVLLSRAGEEAKGLQLAKDALAGGIYDFDLLSALTVLAWRAGDFTLAEQAIERRSSEWPHTRSRGYLQLGNMHDQGTKDRARALEAFRQALASAAPADRAAIQDQIPPAYRQQLEPAGSNPAGTTQMSTSKR